MKWTYHLEKLSQRGYEWSVVCGPEYHISHIPDSLKSSIRCEPFIGIHALRSSVKCRLTSYLHRGIIAPKSFREPSCDELDSTERQSIHFLLRRGNLIAGSIRGTLHHFHTENPQWFCKEMLDRCGRLDDAPRILEYVRNVERTSDVYFEVSGWYMNPDLKSAAVYAVLMPSMVWAFTSSFVSSFPGLATLRGSNRAAKMLINLGGLEFSDCCYYDDLYQGEVRILGLHSRGYTPLIEDAVEFLKGELQQIPIITTAEAFSEGQVIDEGLTG